MKKIKAWAICGGSKQELVQGLYLEDGDFVYLISSKKAEAEKVLQAEMNPPEWIVRPVLITFPTRRKKNKPKK